MRLQSQYKSLLLLGCFVLTPWNALAAPYKSPIQFDERIQDPAPELEKKFRETPTDASQSNMFGGCGTDVTESVIHAARASNLADCNHFKEALKEINIAVADKSEGRSRYLFQRAKLFYFMNNRASAIPDFLKASTATHPFESIRFPAAIGLLKCEQFAAAEKVFKIESQSAYGDKKILAIYFLALSQQYQNKKSEAIANFKKAAELFSVSDQALSTAACIDKVNQINGVKSESATAFTIANLKKPRAHFERVVGLVHFLSSSTDGLDLNQISKLSNANFAPIANTDELSSNVENGLFREYKWVSIKPSNKIKVLTVTMNLQECVISKDDIKKFFIDKKAITSSGRMNDRYATSEAYEVPSGILELWWASGGFYALRGLSLYPHGATYPPKIMGPFGDGPNFSDYGFRMFDEPRLHKLGLEHAELYTKMHPERYESWMYKAKFLSYLGKYHEAIVALDKAISIRGEIPLENRKYGDRFLLYKASYLLGSGKVDEAVKAYKQAKSQPENSDELLVRGKIRIAQKRYEEAVVELRRASKKFYEEMRIVKRDEAEKLISQIQSARKSH